METPEQKKYKVLVVDDNNQNIQVIGTVLRQNNYLVGFATSGQQALDILNEKDEDYDLVLLDVNMPEMNGFEVCKIIRETQKLKDLPIIFLTANAESDQIVKGFTCGGQDYITKPFNASELMSRINTHVELKRSRDKLKSINTFLEEKVRERTLDLVKTSKKLEETNKNLEQANKELEKLDIAKAEFLRIISHEINTPLNGILGFVGLLKDRLQATEYFNYIESLNNSVYRLNEFAKTSLVLTGLRTSPENFEKVTVDIMKLLNGTLKKVEDLRSKKNIQIHSIATHPQLTLDANEELLGLCMYQLLKNALEFTPDNQIIEIKTYKLVNQIKVAITDSGPGFSETALENLHKPFNPGEKHIDKNKGLGLYLAKMIADFHHAKISVSNEIDGGATVTLLFDC